MSKKLYCAEVTTFAYFVAEEGEQQSESRKHIREALRDADSDVDSVDLVCEGDPIEGDWETYCCVYGVEGGDLTLADAIKQFSGPMRPAIKKFHDDLKKLNAAKKGKDNED